jgi:hypothetical protein
MARFTLLALIAVALAAGAHAQVTGARTSKGKANVMGKSKGKGKKSCQKQAKGRWGTMNGEHRTNGSGDCIVEVNFSQMDIGVIRNIAGGSGTDWCWKDEGNIAAIAVQLNNVRSAMASNLSASELFNAIKSYLGKPCKGEAPREESKGVTKGMRKKAGTLGKKAKKQRKIPKRQSKASKKGQISGPPIAAASAMVDTGSKATSKRNY